ncbi:MAG: polysaccharide ABC transporter ATP-binding protein [bacterium]
MSEVAIRVNGLGKRYRIGRRESYRTLRDSLTDLIHAPLRHLSLWTEPTSNADEQPQVDDGHVWALRDVSLEIKRGEVLGVIGRNGAGKTTLLKILSRITEPTEGHAEIHGRVGSLLEVGTGFHPELTGRENIYLNGAILGMKRVEIERKFDEIVAFAEIERFIDTPVKRYSSGMYVRLAFAVAAHLELEVLFVDEILAVGDLTFQNKCLGKMGDVAKEGRTVLFVSHNMTAVRNLCGRAVVLDQGQLNVDGSGRDAIEFYIRTSQRAESAGYVSPILQDSSPRFRKLQITSFGARLRGQPGMPPQSAADAEFIVGYSAAESYPLPKFGVHIFVSDMNGVNIFVCSTGMTRLRHLSSVPPTGFAICLVKNLPLIPGKYRVGIAIKDFSGFVEEVPNIATFEVTEGGISDTFYYPSPGLGSVLVSQEWKCMSTESET